MATRTDVTLGPGNCCWIFVAASQEDRHLHDIIFGVHSLRGRGIADKDVYIFIDHVNGAAELAKYKITDNVHHLKDFHTAFKAIPDYESLFLTVTGHGVKDGIQCSDSKITFNLKPHELIAAVQSKTSLKCAALALCQCYAGVFNFMEVSKHPETCIIGATSLHNSSSWTMKAPTPIPDVTGTNPLVDWGANVFMFYLFKWLSAPSDVDGDGKNSINDAFKFAGVETNEWILTQKSVLSFQQDEWLYKKKAQLSAPGLPPPLRDAIARVIESNLQIFHLHQEPWILHSNLGRTILF